VFLVDNSAELLAVLVGVLTVLAFTERLMGTARTVVVFFTTAMAGTGIGVVIQGIGVARGELWSRGVSELWTLDPFTPIAGTVMAASCFAGPLWRRRIRVLTVAGVLALLLYSGQPSDLYRLIAAGAGLAAGTVMRPGPVRTGWRRSSDHEARTLLAAVVGILAVGPVFTVFAGSRYGLLAPLGLLLTQDVPAVGDVVDRCLLGDITRQCLRELTVARVAGVGPILLSLLPLLALLVAALGLARGRRFAAWFAIAVNVGMAALGAWYYGLVPVADPTHPWHWSSPRYWEIALVIVVSILVPLVVAVLLAANLHRFPVRSRPGRAVRFVVATVSSFVGLATLYVAAGWLLREHFRPAATLADLILDVPERFIPVAFLRLERLSFLPDGPLAEILYQWVGPAFWIVVISAAVLAMRSAPDKADRDDRARLRALLAQGGGSLAFMATWEGNALWFSADRTRAIAYRVVNGVAITTSDPIGRFGGSSSDDAADAAQTIADFATMCDDHGWIPVFYSVHRPWLPVFSRMGWHTMSVGEETVLRPRTWNTSGKKWQDIRSSINRAHRAGVRAVWTRYADLPLRQALQITEISEQWVQEKGLPELGFTLGGLDELRDRSVRLMIALGQDDRVEAVTSWLPSYRDGVIIGWTLDFMRRRPEGMNGVMEFLIAETASLLQDDPEIEFLSLSAAPLARAVPGVDAGLDEGVHAPDSDPAAVNLAARVLGVLARRLEPVYGFQSLLAFKTKFQPEFHPLFMAFPDPSALPAIGFALARAYLPGLSVREVVAFVRSLG
jgi:lysylphosphatidylglycerol synthetase-like protein (DUF2156 family)